MSTFCQRRGLVVEKSQIFVNVVCERPSSNFGHSDVEIWQPCFRYLLTTELTIITVFRLDYNLYVFSFNHNCIIIMLANLLILLQVATEIYMPRPPNLASCFELKTFSVWGRRWPSSWPWDGVIRKIKNITSIFCHAAFARWFSVTRFNYNEA